MGWQQSTRWQRTRLVVLERDEFRCRVRLPGCEGEATDADHVIPPADGGDRWDLANLRAACGFCNRSRASRQKHREGWRRSSTRIVLVVGAASDDRAAHVAEHAGPQDVVVDYDAIAAAIGSDSHDVVNAARGAVLTRVRRGEVDAPKVWIVSGNAEAESMFPHHEVADVGGRQTDCEDSPGPSRDWYGHAPV